MRNCRTVKDIAREVSTSGSGNIDPEVVTSRVISLSVSQLPTPFFFLSYNHRTIAHAVANDLITSSWKVVSNISPSIVFSHHMQHDDKLRHETSECENDSK